MAQKVADGTKKKSPESEAQIMALILTVMVWLVVAAFIILFPGKILQNQEPQVYQDISLRLSAVDGNSFTSVASAPLEEVVSESAVSALPEERMAPVQPEVKAPLPVSETPAGVPAGTPKPVEPVPVKKTPSAKPVEGAPVKKPASAKPVEGAPVKKPAVSPAEPVATQSPSAPSVEPVDVAAMDDAEWEALFAEKGSRSYNTAPASAVSPNASSSVSSSLSGVAGSVEKEGASALAHESEKNQSSASGLSQETAAALERITSLAEGGVGLASTGETTSVSQSAGTTASQSAGTTAFQSAGTDLPSTMGAAMNLVGGGSRRLLEPKEPVIVISEKNQSLIMGTIEVAITFEITPEGLVLPSSIKISPESLVHGQVQAEIKSQIEKWRFQVAQGSGQVRFKCNIIKK